MKTGLTFSTQLADINDPEIAAAVWKLVKACDDDFVPPLRWRNSTVARNLINDLARRAEEPVLYFDMLKEQYLLIASLANKIVGFISFRNQYSCAELNGWNPSNYITTICVERECRGMGVGAALYHTILAGLPDELACHYATTRTWDGNSRHILLLKSYGFKLVHHAANDRGSGIGSLYWAKEICA
ncbi:GNAT family N-acetyltransferase [candidate division KSB1 bacterium]|nr:GNAT family N-acetyltransferase [candidate division KSB1 bacterium]